MKNFIKRLLSLSLFVIINCINIPIYSQVTIDQPQWKNNILTKNFNKGTPHQINHIQKKPGHYSKTDWAEVIDATWGDGLPTAEKL